MKEEIIKIKSEVKFDTRKLNELEKILADMGLNEDSLLVALLYIAIKSEQKSIDEISTIYPENVINTINILIKLDKINYSQQSVEAENIRKMFFAITKDIRTIMLKIAFVVTELRFIDEVEDEKKIELANSIFALFAPLSARLGLSAFKTELENGAFKILDPKKYDEIQNEVDSRFHKRQPIVERLKTLVNNCMKDLGITGRVYGRKKHI